MAKNIIPDANTGHTVALQMFFAISEHPSTTASEIGKALMDRLEIENQVQIQGVDHAGIPCRRQLSCITSIWTILMEKVDIAF